jgi:hypothetical protein
VAAAADFFPPDYDGIRPTLNTVSRTEATYKVLQVNMNPLMRLIHINTWSFHKCYLRKFNFIRRM